LVLVPGVGVDHVPAKHLRQSASLLADELLHDRLPQLIVRVEIDADYDARDQHDDSRLDHLRLARPLDLLQLSPRFREEGAATFAALCAGLALGGLLRRTDLRLALPCALRDSSALLLGLAARAALRSRLTGHQRVSRCSVWLPHQR